MTGTSDNQGVRMTEVLICAFPLEGALPSKLMFDVRVDY